MTTPTKAENAAKYPPDDKQLDLCHMRTTEVQYTAECHLDKGGLRTSSLAERVRRTKGAQSHHSAKLLRPSLRGVNFETRKGVWRARLYCKGDHVTLGRFPTAESAARAHDRAAVFVMGNQARTNFGTCSTRAELERAHVDGMAFSSRPQDKLVALRDRMQEEQGRSLRHIDEQQACAMRQAAAIEAFYGPEPVQLWNGLLSDGQGGRTNDYMRKRDVCDGSKDGGSSSLVSRTNQNIVAMGAWKVLVMAVART
jgi:hypothetical protein